VAKREQRHCYRHSISLQVMLIKFMLARLAGSMLSKSAARGGVVLLNMEMNGVAVSLVKSFRLRQYFQSSDSAEWDETDDIAPHATDDLVCSLKWKQLGGNIVRTLIPPQFAS
jgi:hypothetical protein